MSALLMRLTLVALLIAGLLVPAQVGAQDGQIAFPPVEDGAWEGTVFFSGYTSSDGDRSDGSFFTNVTDVIDDTEITVDFVVGDDGQVTNGKMTVDLTWFSDGVGTMPTTLNPYHVMSDHHETGTLAITGNANRLVAAGTLTHETNVATETSASVEGVSGVETQTVEWVYQGVEATCARFTAALVGATGTSWMQAARLPEVVESGRTTSHNVISTHLLAWPANFEFPQKVWDVMQEVDNLADGIRLREYPETGDILRVVQAWSDLNAELARLDECQTEFVGSVAESDKSWLVGILQEALNKALDNPGFYEASEFNTLWDLGLQEGALSESLMGRFLDVFDTKLDEAIADGDPDTMYDILAFAAAYGFPDLYSRAKAAFEGASG